MVSDLERTSWFKKKKEGGKGGKAAWKRGTTTKESKACQISTPHSFRGHSSGITHQLIGLSTWESSYQSPPPAPTPPPPPPTASNYDHSKSQLGGNLNFPCPLSHNSLQLSGQHAEEGGGRLQPLLGGIRPCFSPTPPPTLSCPQI